MNTLPAHLPPAVQQILGPLAASAKAPGSPSTAQEALLPGWSSHVERARADAPYAVVADDGETIYTGSLSPGCLACKNGSWDCLFLTGRCNLACPFCCSPSLPKASGRAASVSLSAFGGTLDDVVERLRVVEPEGISFSGGEIFLEFDRLRGIVERVRAGFPRAYLWVYTNGLLASGEMLAELGELGIDEIRFNLAATGYQNPAALRSVEQASRSLPTVTVEIPAIPADEEKLLAALSVWSNLGVRYLNLHELMYEPGSLSASLPGPRVPIRTPDGHYTEIHPASRALTLRVMQAAHAAGLPLAVNDCSMQNKLRQVRGRRALYGRFFDRQPGSTETLADDGLLHTICAFNAQGECAFFRPEALPTACRELPGFRFLHLWRVPPLSIYERRKWAGWEEMDPPA